MPPPMSKTEKRTRSWDEGPTRIERLSPRKIDLFFITHSSPPLSTSFFVVLMVNLKLTSLTDMVFSASGNARRPSSFDWLIGSRNATCFHSEEPSSFHSAFMSSKTVGSPPLTSARTPEKRSSPHPSLSLLAESHWSGASPPRSSS